MRGGKNEMGEKNGRDKKIYDDETRKTAIRNRNGG